MFFSEQGQVEQASTFDAELHFQRDDSNRVNAVVLHQGAIEQRAERIER